MQTGSINCFFFFLKEAGHIIRKYCTRGIHTCTRKLIRMKLTCGINWYIGRRNYILRRNSHRLCSHSGSEPETYAKLRLTVPLPSHRANFVCRLAPLTRKWINVDTRVWHRQRGDIPGIRSGDWNAAKIRTGNHVDYVITADSRATLKSWQLRNYGKRKRARRARNEKKTWNLLNAERNSEPRPRWPSEGV